LKTYEEFLELCSSKRKLIPEEHLKLFDKEVKYAKRFYDNGRNLFEELQERRPTAKTPLMFALGYSQTIEDKHLKMVQVKPGSSGGI
jgi:hypothetical protein